MSNQPFMESIKYQGAEYNLFDVVLLGKKYQVFLTEARYGNGTLAVEVMEVAPGLQIMPFARLTTNLDLEAQSTEYAFIKTYSENEGWAESLANKVGEYTGCTIHQGYTDFPLYKINTKLFYKR